MLVFGLGGVGQNIIQAASMVSAYPIIGVDLQKNKLEMAEKFGLTHGIESKSKNIESEVRNLVGNEGVDVVIDTTGNSRVIETSYNLTNKDGKTTM